MARQIRREGASRAAALVLAALLNGALAVGLMLAFAPDVVREANRADLIAFQTSPAATIDKPPAKAATRKPAGGSGKAGRKAVPRPVTAPVPRLALAAPPAPQAASTGAAQSSGARDSSSGNGAGSAANGTGAGDLGEGEGGASRFVQIAGRIDSASDYPAASRAARIGHSVLIVFTVGIDGRVHDCRVREPSGDPEADVITCRLAVERFRFRPSTDARGNAVPDVYGWRQRWFY